MSKIMPLFEPTLVRRFLGVGDILVGNTQFLIYYIDWTYIYRLIY